VEPASRVDGARVDAGAIGMTLGPPSVPGTGSGAAVGVGGGAGSVGSEAAGSAITRRRPYGKLASSWSG
jgi:hypothetical protein